MKRIKKLLGLVMSLTLLISMVIPVQASGNTDSYIEQLIQYYANYQENAQTDIERVLGEIQAEDETLYEEWSQIMDYWSYVNTDMTVYTDVAPDGLADDDSLCIVVLGFALNPDGTMKDELIGRLQVALASAEKYPNAYVACTGGGTAENNPDATEADQMAAWLIENGVDENRVIVENQSKSTVENAQFTYAILRKSYPQIDSLCMVTSDYHVQRGCLLYYAQCLLSAYQAGDKKLEITSNAGYVTGSQGYESISLQANGLAQVAEITVDLDNVPKLSELTDITVSGADKYQPGDGLSISVTANYDSGYSKDVTSQCAVTGYDPQVAGSQMVTVSYTENGITKEASFQVTVAADTATPDNDDNKDVTSTPENPSQAPADTTSAAESNQSAAPVTGDETGMLPIILLGASVCAIAVCVAGYRRNNKYYK